MEADSTRRTAMQVNKILKGSETKYSHFRPSEMSSHKGEQSVKSGRSSKNSSPIERFPQGIVKSYLMDIESNP